MVGIDHVASELGETVGKGSVDGEEKIVTEVDYLVLVGESAVGCDPLRELPSYPLPFQVVPSRSASRGRLGALRSPEAARCMAKET